MLMLTTNMKNIPTIIIFAILLLLVFYYRVQSNHWHQVHILHYEVPRLCNEIVGPERTCKVVSYDGGFEGETYYMTDGDRRLMFVAGPATTYPIFTVKRKLTKEDFRILQLAIHQFDVKGC
jgi:hypothetical protein